MSILSKIKLARPCWDYFTKLQFDYVIAQTSDCSGGKVCDIGCGDGRLSIKIATDNRVVYGVDVANSNVEMARKLAGLSNHQVCFYVADAEKLPFPSQFFDLVICNCALEHFDHDDLALQEMSRIIIDGVPW